MFFPNNNQRNYWLWPIFLARRLFRNRTSIWTIWYSRIRSLGHAEVKRSQWRLLNVWWRKVSYYERKFSQRKFQGCL